MGFAMASTNAVDEFQRRFPARRIPNRKVFQNVFATAGETRMFPNARIASEIECLDIELEANFPDMVEKNPNINMRRLVSQFQKANAGFVFTCSGLVEVRDKLLENKVRAPARPGAIAPVSVIIPAQNTGLDPEKTYFFQALSIPTKISKGTIEIIDDVHILKPGNKVGASEVTLLNMLNISLYDSGIIFATEILYIKPEDLRERFMIGVANLASVYLSIGYPTNASSRHSIANGFKNLLAITATTDADLKEATTVKEFIKDPSKFAPVTALAAAATAPAAQAAGPAKEEKKEGYESEDNNMGFGLFD